MRKLLLAPALLALALAGCFHVRYVTDVAPAPSASSERWHHDFVFGLVEASDPVPLDAICPAGYAVVESEMTFVNGLVQLVTGALYDPQSVTVICSAAGPPPSTSPSRPYEK